MSDLRTLQRNWEEAALADPLWAILTAPGKAGGRWDIEEFFASGRQEIAGVLDYLDPLGLPAHRRRALDFGCGVGRLAQALAERFEEVDGVDVAPAMVEQARKLNQHESRCRYHVNAEPDLRLFPDDHFDLVYSNLVLQHVGPELACGYIREFVRVLAPNGVALFQVPSEPIRPELQGAAAQPLPEDAYRARLTPARQSIAGLPGSRMALPVRVTNTSPRPWPVAGSPQGHDALHLGNHWRTRGGRLVTLDDARCGLPSDVPPGGSVDLVLEITLPTRSGRYVLELDMVHEHVTWFAARDSPSVRLPVHVTGPKRRFRRGPSPEESGTPHWSREALSMHGVPRDRVLALLADAGGQVVDVQEDQAAGSGWISFRYAVTKGEGDGTRPGRRE